MLGGNDLLQKQLPQQVLVKRSMTAHDMEMVFASPLACIYDLNLKP